MQVQPAGEQTATIRRAAPDDAPELAGLLHSLQWVARLSSEPVEKTTETVRRHLEQCLADESHSVYGGGKIGGGKIGGGRQEAGR